MIAHTCLFCIVQLPAKGDETIENLTVFRQAAVRDVLQTKMDEIDV